MNVIHETRMDTRPSNAFYEEGEAREIIAWHREAFSAFCAANLAILCEKGGDSVI